MILSLSLAIVVILGLVVCALSVWGLVQPTSLVRFVRSAMERDWGIYVAILVRVVLGLALIVAAPESRFPLAFSVLGWIAILAAAGLAILGRKRMRALIAWFDRLSPAFVRLWLLLGIAFGGLLIYGAYPPGA